MNSLSTVKTTTFQDTEISKEMSPNTRTLETVVNSNVKSELSENGARIEDTYVTGSSAFKTSIDSISAVTQTSHSDASEFNKDNSEHIMNSLSTTFAEEQKMTTVKLTTNGVEKELKNLQVTETAKEMSTQRSPNTSILESVVNSTVKIDPSRIDITNVTESSTFKKSIDSISAVTHTTHFMKHTSASTMSSPTVENKFNSNTDTDFEDINHLVIILGVVSVLMMVILVAVASTVVMKRKKRHYEEFHLSSQYTALLD